MASKISILCFVVCVINYAVTTEGIPELQYLNESIDPCDDFYEFTCGNFKNIHPLPDGQSSWDHFYILQEEIHTLAKDILNTPRKITEPKALQKAKAFYTGCMNTQAMESLGNGYKAHAQFIEKVQKWPAITVNYNTSEEKLSWNDLAELTAEYGLSFFFDLTLQPSMYNAHENAIFIFGDSLSNPDASGIRPELPQHPSDYLGGPITSRADEVLPYEQFLRNIAFKLRDVTGEWNTPNDHIIAELEDTINYMRDVANLGARYIDIDVPVLFPETTVQELQEWTNNLFGDDFIDWVQFLNKIINRDDVQVTNDTAIIQMSDIIYGLLNMYKQTTPKQIKNYVVARLLTHMAPDSDQFMREQWKEYAESNLITIYSRSDYCVRKTLGYIGNIDFSMAVTYEYQKYHFDINKLEKASNMVNDIFGTFMDVLSHADWMDEESKAIAYDKAMKMVVLLGYPENIVEQVSELNNYYNDLKVCSWDHFGNAQRLRVFELTQSLEPIGDKKKPDLWTLSPLEVNAFYNRGYNRVLLPVSILNNIFFTGQYNLLDYARLGSIIGHEITHGFDKSGKTYTAEGVNGANLWSESTLQQFLERETCFNEQYSKYYIKEIDAYVNATNTLNENLADNGGLSTAYKTFLKLKLAKNIDVTQTKYTPEQLFFIGYGTMWCTEASKLYMENMNFKGAYAPARYRVIGAVSNMPEFAEAFQCKKGSNMNPEKKCQLW